MERIKIKSLIKDLDVEVKGSQEVEITGLCSNSKLVGPGHLFIAKKEAHPFIENAIQAGAAAILTDLYNPFLSVTQLIHPDVAEIEKLLAERFYGSPSKKLRLIGITGTNGKTTSTYLIKHLLDCAGVSCGLMGSIERIVGNHHFPSPLNTPELVTIQKLLSEMVLAEQKAAVMEVSSHGIDQGRIRGLEFSVALFTNLTQDHLDYHGTMEVYAATKRKLFEMLEPHHAAIFNADDPYAESFVTQAKRITFGIEKPATLNARDIELSAEGVAFTVVSEGQTARIKSALIGRFNVYNLLGALAVGMQFGIKLEEAARHFLSFKRVPGRMSPVPTRHPAHVFVDYAHTDDALENVLSTLQELKKKRIITLFGCGGDRDRGKRPKMGMVVEKFSDLVVLTSDNPRSEDPALIVEDVLKGMQKPPAVIELDRRLAIEKALKLAEPGDIVLIAGKGHEKVQIFAHQTLPFDDFEIAREIANSLAATR